VAIHPNFTPRGDPYTEQIDPLEAPGAAEVRVSAGSSRGLNVGASERITALVAFWMENEDLLSRRSRSGERGGADGMALKQKRGRADIVRELAKVMKHYEKLDDFGKGGRARWDTAAVGLLEATATLILPPDDDRDRSEVRKRTRHHLETIADTLSSDLEADEPTDGQR
jgi:hypothetical protein